MPNANDDEIKQINRPAYTTFIGTDGDDTITGTKESDVLISGAGNDRLDGGSDIYISGAGADTLFSHSLNFGYIPSQLIYLSGFIVTKNLQYQTYQALGNEYAI